MLRWVATIVLFAPLVGACGSDTSGERTTTTTTATQEMRASNSNAAAQDADMKEVILNVFGMT